MNDIRLNDGTININGEWLSVEDLTQQIQEKIQAGDMKLTNLAEALEELNNALENSHTLEVKLVITKDEYERLREFGGDDDSESVRKAIYSFVDSTDRPEETVMDTVADDQIEILTINCPHPQCMTPIEITTEDRPIMVECPNCGISGWLTAENEWGKPSEA